jgi:hypothetical protein
MKNFKQFLRIVIVGACFGAWGISRQVLADELPLRASISHTNDVSTPLVAPPTEVAISGTPQFTNQVFQALALLLTKAPEAYTCVTNYMGKIEQGKKSGMWAYRNPPTYEMADQTAFYSVTWCAGSIAHDSFHSKLYHEYKAKHRGLVPDKVWTDVEAEKKCLQHQLAVLKKIGAPKSEIDHLEKMTGTHHDTNNDGKYDWDDYQKRNW